MNASELSIIGPAILASLLVLSTHVPLGTEVLRRGIIFIDLAIAQVAGLGVIAADSMGWEAEGIMVQIAAVSAALIAAYVLHWTDKRWPQIQEALIGVAFVLAATAGILLLAGNPHGGEHLKELLVGQILWVNYDQLLPTSIVSALVLLAWYFMRDRLQGFGFYALRIRSNGISPVSRYLPGLCLPNYSRAGHTTYWPTLVAHPVRIRGRHWRLSEWINSVFERRSSCRSCNSLVSDRDGAIIRLARLANDSKL